MCGKAGVSLEVIVFTREESPFNKLSSEEAITIDSNQDIEITRGYSRRGGARVPIDILAHPLPLLDLALSESKKRFLFGATWPLPKASAAAQLPSAGPDARSHLQQVADILPTNSSAEGVTGEGGTARRRAFSRTKSP